MIRKKDYSYGKLLWMITFLSVYEQMLKNTSWEDFGRILCTKFLWGFSIALELGLYPLQESFKLRCITVCFSHCLAVPDCIIAMTGFRPKIQILYFSYQLPDALPVGSLAKGMVFLGFACGGRRLCWIVLMLQLLGTLFWRRPLITSQRNAQVPDKYSFEEIFISLDFTVILLQLFFLVE